MQLTLNRNLALALGTLLAFPAAYFISTSLLKFGLRLPYLYDSVEPFYEKLGSKEPLGFNINLLILFGPLLALGINLLAVLKVEWFNENNIFSIKVSLKKHWWNMVLLIISVILLVTLFIYALGENCKC